MSVPSLFSICAREIFKHVSANDESWRVISSEHFNQLPFDVHQKIYHELKKNASEGRQFFNAHFFKVYFSFHPSFLFDYQGMNEESLASIDFSNIVKIKFTHHNEIKNLSSWIAHCQKIEELSVPFIQLSPLDIEAIANHCTHLWKLKSGLTEAVNSSMIEVLKKQCPKLTSIIFVDVLNYRNLLLEKLLHQEPCLQNLSLNLAAKSLSYNVTSGYELLSLHSHSMTSLTLENVHTTSNWLQAILTHLVCLQRLKMSGSRELSGEEFVEANKLKENRIHRLVYLGLHSHSRLSDQFVAALIEENPQLQVADFVSCSMLGDLTLKALSKNSTLSYINFSYCSQIFSNEFFSTAMMKNLKGLILQGSRIGGAGISTFLTNASQLAYAQLNIEDCNDPDRAIPLINHPSLNFFEAHFRFFKGIEIHEFPSIKRITILSRGRGSEHITVVKTIIEKNPHLPALRLMSFDDTLVPSFAEIALNHPQTYFELGTKDFGEIYKEYNQPPLSYLGEPLRNPKKYLKIDQETKEPYNYKS